jgi:hypothetical protein
MFLLWAGEASQDDKRLLSKTTREKTEASKRFQAL